MSKKQWEKPETTWAPLRWIAPFLAANDFKATGHSKPFDKYRTRIKRRAVVNSDISEGILLLYARVGSVSAPFERLPPDIWPLLKIKDWNNGAAIAPDGTWLYSIHAEYGTPSPQTKSKGKSGRRPKVDWDGKIKQKFFELLEHHGLPDPSDDEWKSQADVERALFKICGDDVSESTVRKHTVRLIAEWQKQRAEN